MEKASINAARFWAADFSDKVRILKGMSTQFIPGKLYYYIASLNSGEIEYVSEDVTKILGFSTGDFYKKKWQKLLTDYELNSIQKKEGLIRDFFNNFCDIKESKNYKAIYFFRIRNAEGRLLNIMHQATPLTFNDSGKVDYLLIMHADTSLLGLVKNEKVSFVNIKGNESYINVDTTDGSFKPYSISEEEDLFEILTNRELEIVKLMADGLAAEQIADKLIISFNTIRTHRKNMLRKTGCANSTHLVARCMAANLI